MILESILNLLKNVILTVFGILPSIPSFENAQESINTFFDVIFQNSSLLGIFINVNTIKICIPILIVIINFERIYNLVLWIIKKIPMLGME